MSAAAPALPRTWLHPEWVDDDARVRLFLIPPAGSSGLAYREWTELLPARIGAQALTLPGRYYQPGDPYTEWDDVLEAALDAVVPELDDRPFAFFGHSLGALLAFRLALRLEADGTPPAVLGVSGWSPSGFSRPPGARDRVPEAELVDWVRRSGSVPTSVCDDPEMLALVLPSLRADLAVLGQYADDGAGTDVPIVSYGGRSDPLMDEPDAMAHWAERTAHHLGHTEFPGGHFYLEEHVLSVVTDLVGHLDRRTPGT